MAGESKPQIDQKIADWSGAKTGGQDSPLQPDLGKGRALFGPARRTVTPEEAAAAVEATVKEAAERAKTFRPRPNYRLPD